MRPPLGVARLAMLVLLAAVAEGVAVSSGCRELGFTETLVCSKCDRLAEAIKDEELVKECRSCCTQDVDEDEAMAKAAQATLEVCTWKLSHFPDVKGFIDNKASTHPKLKIDYVRGAPPALVLKDEKEGVMDTVRIDSWNTDTIDEYLKERLS